MTSLARHLQRIRRHGLWMGLAVGLLWVLRRIEPIDALRGATDVGGNFLQAYVGIYGLVLAFAIFVTWTQHNETQVAVEEEANVVADLHRLLGWFDRWPGRGNAQGLLRQYISSVPRQRAEGAREELPERELIDRVIAAILEYRTLTPAEERLWPKAVDLAHEVHSARERRVTRGELRLPDGLRWFVILGGAGAVAVLMLLRVDAFWLHAGFVALLTWAVVASVSIVLDLDNPYTGDFILDWSRFDEALQRMDAAPPGA